MRNWNWRVCSKRGWHRKRVASLPMRNWNHDLRKIWNRKTSSCEPTYEELKLPTNPSRDSFLRRCEPTYEELKHQKQYNKAYQKTTLRAYLWGIETKILYLIYPFLGFVASLPMRNWNYSWKNPLRKKSSSCEPTYEELKPSAVSPTEYVPSLLRAYLWGIETYFGI